MDKNIVEQVARIEQQADAIIADAGRAAATLRASLDAKIDAHRDKQESALGQRISRMQQETAEAASQDCRRLEEEGKADLTRLESLDEERVNAAIELVAKSLRGDAACP